jgi:hypothetical protein
MSPSPWRSLEEFPGLGTFAQTWQSRMGPDFDAIAALCLDPSDRLATAYPCPHDCGCSHHVIPRHDGEGAVAVCRCDPPVCPDIHLTRAQITPLDLNFAKLGRALCQAFGLARKFVELTPPDTFQIGAWSADAVPAILTIQVDPDVFRGAVAELTSTLRRPFILFAPTSTHLDAPCQAMLENHGAAFFPLDANVLITEYGMLHPRRAPGELFTRFNPQPKEINEDDARRAFALVDKIEDSQTYSVFRLYCRQGLSTRDTARQCRCSKTTVLRRLNEIRAITGMDPKYLRILSTQFAQIESEISDPRAPRVHRKSLL